MAETIVLEKNKQIKTFNDLNVWKKAHKFVLQIYQATESFPDKERFCIISQIRRSAISIPTNLAEGGKRQSKKDFAHFVNIAEGSLEETKYHLLLSKDIGYLKTDTYEILVGHANEIGRMLYSLRRNLTRNSLTLNS